RAAWTRRLARCGGASGLGGRLTGSLGDRQRQRRAQRTRVIAVERREPSRGRAMAGVAYAHLQRAALPCREGEYEAAVCVRGGARAPCNFDERTGDRRALRIDDAARDDDIACREQ